MLIKSLLFDNGVQIRSIGPDDLHRQAPCSIEILPSGLLAIGCQDGKVRIWSPQLWRIVDTIDTGSTKGAFGN